MNNLKKYQDSLRNFVQALSEVKKVVNIQIALEDLENLKRAKYKLCFAKKVGDNDYNVVWYSFLDYLPNNTFSWTPQYGLFGSNIFKDYIKVQVHTNIVTISLGETSILNSYGVLEDPTTGGPEFCFTMDNQYGSIHPGVNQLSIGIDGQIMSTPIYVAEAPIVKGRVVLKPVEKVLVWFEQNIETSTMFSTARSNEVEIDLTFQNKAARKYENQRWITI